MRVEATVIDKCKMAFGTEVDVTYTCPHCGETVTECITFGGDCTDYVALLEGHECYECCEEIDLAVDFYGT